MQVTLAKAIALLQECADKLPAGIAPEDVVLGVFDNFGNLVPIDGFALKQNWIGTSVPMKVPVVEYANQRITDETPTAYAIEITGPLQVPEIDD